MLQVEINYLEGAIYALISIILGVLFTLFNGKLITNQDSSIITFYEFLSGVIFISFYLVFHSHFALNQLKLTYSDFMLLLILSSICTAYAFTASVKLMKKLSPYTVMLTTSLEPVYGIVLAYFIIGDKEKMSLGFYIGALVILFTVILNGILKLYYSNKN